MPPSFRIVSPSFRTERGISSMLAPTDYKVARTGFLPSVVPILRNDGGKFRNGGSATEGLHRRENQQGERFLPNSKILYFVFYEIQ